MYLLKSKSHGRYYLFLAESVHVPGKGSTKKILERYGRWEDAPEEIKQAYEDQRKKKKLSAEFEAQYRNKVFAQAAKSLNEQAQKQDKDPLLPMPPLYYGHVPLLKIWNQDLDLRTCLYDLQRRHDPAGSSSVNDWLCYLCCRKILFPASSFLDACQDRGHYFCYPWPGMNEADLCKALDFMHEHGQTIIAHALKAFGSKRPELIRIYPYDLKGDCFISQKPELDEYSCDDDFDPHRVLFMTAVDQTGTPVDLKVFTGDEVALESYMSFLYEVKRKHQADGNGFMKTCFLPQDAGRRLSDFDEAFGAMLANPALPDDCITQERITACCYLCFLSLLMMRMVQIRLEGSGRQQSLSTIGKILSSAAFVAVPAPVKDYSEQLLINVALPSQGMADPSTAGEESQANLLLTALGSKPVPLMTTAAKAQTCLGIIGRSNDVCDAQIRRLLDQI